MTLGNRIKIPNQPAESGLSAGIALTAVQQTANNAVATSNAEKIPSCGNKIPAYGTFFPFDGTIIPFDGIFIPAYGTFFPFDGIFGEFDSIRAVAQVSEVKMGVKMEVKMEVMRFAQDKSWSHSSSNPNLQALRDKKLETTLLDDFGRR